MKANATNKIKIPVQFTGDIPLSICHIIIDCEVDSSCEGHTYLSFFIPCEVDVGTQILEFRDVKNNIYRDTQYIQ